MANIKYASKNSLSHLVANINDTYLKKNEVVGYEIAAGTAADGMASTYILKKSDGSQAGLTINIPKDIFVQDVSKFPVTVTEADNPVTGYKVGDKYIDFTIATSKDAAESQHLYLLVSDLCDEYFGDGKAITLDTSTNQFSLKVDSTNANGLEVTDAGLKMNLASTTAAGAMSTADKVKLDAALTDENFEEVTNAEIDEMFGITPPSAG